MGLRLLARRGVAVTCRCCSCPGDEDLGPLALLDGEPLHPACWVRLVCFWARDGGLV